MTPQDWLAYLRGAITTERCKQLLIELVRVPSPQTELMEAEPLLRKFIETAVEPRLRAMGFSDIRYDPMGNLISVHGADRTGKSLMLITNAMNQPQATMSNAYAGDVVDGAPYGLPGEAVLGKGASEQKATMAAMLIAMEAVIASGEPIAGRLVHLCCVSGETGRHDAIRSVIEGEGVRADMAILGGSSLELSLGNRGRIDVFITVHGAPAHSSRPQDGCNAVTGAIGVAPPPSADQARPALSPARPRIADHQPHPQLPREHSHHPGLLRADGRSPAGTGRRSGCGVCRDRSGRAASGWDAGPGERQAVACRGQARSVHVSVADHADTDVVQELIAACEEVLGSAPKTFYSPNAFDQGYLNHVGIPTVNWGPGEVKYAHTELDMASVERTRDAALVYATMIFRRLT